MNQQANANLLELRELSVEFNSDEGVIRAVDGVSFKVELGKTLGIVGESGCGKSVTAMSIMRLIQEPPGRIVGGEILFRGENLLSFGSKEMRNLRGNRISMIFQEPMTSLNPVMSIGDQLAEAVHIHRKCSGQEASRRSIEMLEMVGISSPQEVVKIYPHQMSGGMRQRIMIAMALFCKPDLLIADEPTTALDVTIQAQIMDLLKQLQSEMGMSVLLITHDLGVVAESCDDVVVMYAGVIVEQGSVEDIFQRPRHPYTLGLLNSIPGFGSDLGAERNRLQTMQGMVPSLLNLPRGCRFQDRCSRVLDKCRVVEPVMVSFANGQSARCYNPVPT